MLKQTEQEFAQDLLTLRLEASKGASQALTRLSEFDAAAVSEIKKSFEAAKQKVALRFRQASSYFCEFPWTLTKVLASFCKPLSQKPDPNRFCKSKAWARKMVDDFDQGLLKKAADFERFLCPTHSLGKSMRRWAESSDTTMDKALFSELVAYATSLITMQRLESKHHLVNQRMGIARNSTPNTLSANLRRALNPDIHNPQFKEKFGSYMFEFDRLVDTPWQSRSELARLISGYSLSLMFADVSTDLALIQSQNVPSNTSKRVLELVAHIKSVLEEGSYYALPDWDSKSGATNYMLVQLVTFTPSTKRYMQKVLKWSEDPWMEKVGVVVLGKTSLHPSVPIIDVDMCDALVPLPGDFHFCSTTSYPTEISVDDFFKTGFSCVYKLEDIDYETVFSVSSVANTADDFGDVDLALMCLVIGSLVGLMVGVTVVFKTIYSFYFLATWCVM